jgi:hypothetical protein
MVILFVEITQLLFVVWFVSRGVMSWEENVSACMCCGMKGGHTLCNSYQLNNNRVCIKGNLFSVLTNNT